MEWTSWITAPNPRVHSSATAVALFPDELEPGLAFVSVAPLEEPEAHRCNNAKISLASLSSSLELGEERTDRVRAWVFCAKGRNVTGCDWRISRSASSTLARISASDKDDGGPESAQKFKRLPIVVGRFGTTISRIRVGLSVVRAVNMRVRVAATSLCVAGGSGLCVYHRISINIRLRTIRNKKPEVIPHR